MSHHHGIGKMFGPWLEGSVGHNEYDVIRVLKNHFDPDNIMNPGGTLGLDLPEEQKKYLRPDIPPRGCRGWIDIPPQSLYDGERVRPASLRR